MPSTNVMKPDEEIKTDVVDELRWDTRVDASKVQVRVDEGVVTLSGTVPSWGARNAAGLDAWSVLGAVRVDNQLTVELPSVPPVPTDDTLRGNAESALDWNPDVDSANISVSVETGVITLKGTVPTHWEKTRAEELVGGLRGVLSVKNELGVTPTESVTDEAIAEDIVSVLERSVVVDAERVDVTVADGIVTLEGSVPSSAALRAAHRAASRTAGVVTVRNHLETISKRLIVPIDIRGRLWKGATDG